MNQHTTLTALTLALAVQPFAAALSLEDVLHSGLRDNLDRKTQELSGELTQARIGQARNAFLPTLRGNAGLTHLWKKPVLEGMPQGYAWTADAGLTLSQTLYSAQTFTSLSLARQAQELDKLSTQAQREALLVQLSTQYWTLAWMEENRGILRDSRTNLERVGQTVQAMVDNGVVRKSDLNSATLAVRAVEASLESLEQQAAAQRNALLKAMGREPDSALTLSDSLGSPTGAGVPEAAERTTALRLAREQVRAKELEESLAGDARLPTVTAFAKYGTQGNSNRFDLHTRPKDRFSDNGLVGIQVDIPLFDGGSAGSARTVARLERRQLEVEEARQSLARKTEVADARRSLETARSQVERQRRNQELARENFRLKEEEYRQQVASLADLLRAESDVIAVRTGLSEARYRETLARLELERSLGQLTARAAR